MIKRFAIVAALATSIVLPAHAQDYPLILCFIAEKVLGLPKSY